MRELDRFRVEKTNGRRNEPFARYSPRGKAENERPELRGRGRKVNGARINIRDRERQVLPRSPLVLCERQRRIRLERRISGRTERGKKPRKGGPKVAILFAGGPEADRFRTINSVLRAAASYDGNRVNHRGREVANATPTSACPRATRYLLHGVHACTTLAVRPVGDAINST